MRFLVEAQLPRRLVYRLRDHGHDALHTLDLPAGNATPDRVVAVTADRDGRVLVTKDADFVGLHLLRRRPARLLLVSTGNTSTPDMERLLIGDLAGIVQCFETAAFVELTPASLVIHGR